MTAYATVSRIRNRIMTAFAVAFLTASHPSALSAAHNVESAGEMVMVVPSESLPSRLNLHYGGTGRPEVPMFRIDVEGVKGLDCNFDTSGIDLPGFTHDAPAFGEWSLSNPHKDVGTARQVGAWLDADGRIVAYAGEFEPGKGVFTQIRVRWHHPSRPPEGSAGEPGTVTREYDQAFRTFKMMFEWPLNAPYHVALKYFEDKTVIYPGGTDADVEELDLNWQVEFITSEVPSKLGTRHDTDSNQFERTGRFDVKAVTADGVVTDLMGHTMARPYIEINGTYLLMGDAWFAPLDPGLLGKIVFTFKGSAVPYVAATIEIANILFAGQANSLRWLAGQSVIEGFDSKEYELRAVDQDSPVLGDFIALTIPQAPKHMNLGPVRFSLLARTHAEARSTSYIATTRAAARLPRLQDGPQDPHRAWFGVKAPPVYDGEYVRVLWP